MSISLNEKILQCNDLNELLEAQKNIEKQLKKVRKAKLAEAQKQVKQLANDLGVTVNELVNEETPAKYVNPNDPTQSWSGRGKKPSWLVELLEKGTKLEDLIAE